MSERRIYKPDIRCLGVGRLNTNSRRAVYEAGRRIDAQQRAAVESTKDCPNLQVYLKQWRRTQQPLSIYIKEISQRMASHAAEKLKILAKKEVILGCACVAANESTAGNALLLQHFELFNSNLPEESLKSSLSK